jgi:hypothetical protein
MFYFIQKHSFQSHILILLYLNPNKRDIRGLGFGTAGKKIASVFAVLLKKVLANPVCYDQI